MLESLVGWLFSNQSFDVVNNSQKLWPSEHEYHIDELHFDVRARTHAARLSVGASRSWVSP